MLQFKYIFIVLLWTAAAFSCKDAFQFHPNQLILDDNEKGLTKKNIEKLKNLAVSDTIRFIVASDTHRRLDETADFVKSANAKNNISFAIHLGDVSASGLVQEYKWFNKVMSGLRFPYLTAAGETDLIGKATIYQEMFGLTDYSFEFGTTRFVVLNTNSNVKDKDGSIPNISWLRSQLSNNGNSKLTVVLAHTPPFDRNFDKNLESQYTGLLASDSDIKFSVYGRQHAFNEVIPYNDSVNYFITTGMQQKGYLLISIWSKGYKVKQINF